MSASVTFDPVTATGTVTPSVFGDPARALKDHTVESVLSGVSPSCTFHLEGTSRPAPEESDWSDISGPVSVTGPKGMVHIVNKPVTRVRVTVSAMSATGIQFIYTGA